MASRYIAQSCAFVSALTISCSAAQAGVFDMIFGNGAGLPIPGVGIPGFRISSPGSGQMQQMTPTPRMVAGQLFNEGLTLADNNKLQESRMKFEQAVKADPSFEAAWSNLIGACMMSGQLEEGIAVGNQFLTNFPHSSKRQKIAMIMEKLNEQLDKRNEIWQKVGPDGADSYFALATEGTKFYGWNLNKMPLRVHIADGHGVRGYRPELQQVLVNSFGEWTNATEHHIVFTKVDNPADSDIECIWIDDPREFPSNKGLEAGMAMPLVDSDGYIEHSKLYILTRERTSHEPVEEIVLHSVLLHEIGHTLGLLGHSDNPNDIMYFSASWQKVQEPHLSKRDVNTLAKLYSTVLTQRSNALITRQEDYHAPAPSPVPVGEVGKPQPYYVRRTFNSNTEAIGYFEKAVSQYPNDLALLDDLGTAYDNYGLELASKKDLQRAEQYFNLALAIHRNSSDPNKLANTLGNLLNLLHFERRDAEAQQLQESCKQRMSMNTQS